MNVSAGEVAEVPPTDVTVTSTAPAAPAGSVTAMEPAESAVMMAVVVPNLTAEAVERLVPVMVTVVPPATDPLSGFIAVTLGAAA